MMQLYARGRLTKGFASATCFFLPLAAVIPIDDQFTTIASWYGPGFDGRKTASGERYDQNKMTAANKTLPFGTKLTVTNLSNGRSCQVVINDRGPYVKGRGIDLSAEAARRIGMSGIAKVLCYNSASAKHSGAPQVDDVKDTPALANNLVAFHAKRTHARPRDRAVQYIAYEGSRRVTFDRFASRSANGGVRTYQWI